jgi:ABC-type polysaccharide/polyol phosphate export permease
MNAATSPHQGARFVALSWTFARRDLSSRFKGTALGWLWSMILPLATLGLYALVFGLIFRAQVHPFGNGHPPIYAVWLFLGLIIFNFFAYGTIRGAESLWSLAGVINRVRLPVYAPVLGSLMAIGLQTLVELTLFLVVLAALVNISWTWLLLPIWILLFFLFTAGLALTSAVAAVYFRDVLHLLSVLMQFLLFATPVMYPLSMVPGDVGGVAVRSVLAHAPLAEFVGLARNLLYDLQPGTMQLWLTVCAWSVASVAVGATVARRYGPDIAEHLQ